MIFADVSPIKQNALRLAKQNIGRGCGILAVWEAAGESFSRQSMIRAIKTAIPPSLSSTPKNLLASFDDCPPFRELEGKYSLINFSTE